MRRWSSVWALCAAGALLGPAAGAEESQEELAEMRALVEQLKARVDAQDEQLEHQGDVIATTQKREEREAASGLSPFLSSVQISGWVAASYFWNFNDPNDAFTNGANGGATGAFYPYHPDHNSFSVDQVWFEIEKPVSEDSRAGFRLDMVYGKTAGVLSSGTEYGVGESASDFNLYQAYIQYLTPWGTKLRAGKFGTLLGAEVAQTIYNFNITRGNVYNLLQPITHYGVILDHSIGPVSGSIGVLNQGSCCGVEPDFNNAKSLLAGLTFAGEGYSIGSSIEWGPEDVGNSSGETGTVDFLAKWDPMERLSTWLNFDYRWATGPGNTDPYGWGIALAGRLGLTEALGFAVRAEYLEDNDNLFGFAPTATGDSIVYGFTGTFDYAITENLVAKAEVRFDKVDTGPGPTDYFIGNGGGGAFKQSDQIVSGLELVYKF